MSATTTPRLGPSGSLRRPAGAARPTSAAASGWMTSMAICSTRSVVGLVVIGLVVLRVVQQGCGGRRDALDPRRGGGLDGEQAAVDGGDGPVGGGERPTGGGVGTVNGDGVSVAQGRGDDGHGGGRADGLAGAGPGDGHVHGRCSGGGLEGGGVGRGGAVGGE